MDNMDEYEMPAERLCERLQSDRRTGLSVEEARARLARNGPNRADYLKSRWSVQLVLKALFGGYKFFLWSCLLFCLVLRGLELMWSSADDDDILYLAGVLLLLVMAATLKTVCKRRPQSFLLERLARLAHQPVRVVRAAQLVSIGSEQVVRGDLVQIGPGDLIPADLRLVESDNLCINNTFLTRETGSGDRVDDSPRLASLVATENLGLFGGLVTQGHARGLVISTGGGTVMSRLVGRAAHGDRNKCLMSKEIEQIKRMIRVSSAAMAVLSYAVFLAAGKTAIETAMFLCGYNIASICLYLQLNEYRDTGCKTD